MLIHPHDDASDDAAQWRSFLETQGFGHFVAAGSHRLVPVVVPTQFLLRDDQLLFHLARPNPVFECLAENDNCLLSVAGDWAYIPGAWKTIGDEDPRRGIPTTYYGAVQLTGRATIVDDPTAIAEVLRNQLAALEPDGDYVDPLEHGKRLGSIRGIVMTITAVRAKFKYGGNVDRDHREHIERQLTDRNGPGDSAARKHLSL